MKIASTWGTGLVCLAIGAGIGILAATYLGIGQPKLPDDITQLTPQAADGGGGPPPGAGKKGGPGGRPAGKMGGGPGPLADMAPNTRTSPELLVPPVFTQLATLVVKLDLLTGTPPSVTLTDEQKQAVAEQLKGLEEIETLTSTEAQKRFDALVTALADHKVALEAVGFRWPGSAARPPQNSSAFTTDEANVQALKSLQQRVAPPPGQ